MYMQNAIKLWYLHAIYTDMLYRLLSAWNVLWIGIRIGDIYAKYVKSIIHACKLK